MWNLESLQQFNGAMTNSVNVAFNMTAVMVFIIVLVYIIWVLYGGKKQLERHILEKKSGWFN